MAPFFVVLLGIQPLQRRASTSWKPKNIDCRSTLGLDDLDRGIAKSENEGFIKLLTKPSTNEFLGVTIT